MKTTLQNSTSLLHNKKAMATAPTRFSGMTYAQFFFDPKLFLGKAKEDGGKQYLSGISGYSQEEAKEDEDEDDEAI